MDEHQLTYLLQQAGRCRCLAGAITDRHSRAILLDIAEWHEGQARLLRNKTATVLAAQVGIHSDLRPAALWE